MPTPANGKDAGVPRLVPTKDLRRYAAGVGVEVVSILGIAALAYLIAVVAAAVAR